MKCSVCKMELKKVDEKKTMNAMLQEWHCKECDIQYDIFFLDGDVVNVYARKLLTN